MELALQIASVVTPILIGFITLVIILSKMHYSIEVLKEKVKILFDFHNKHKK
jgi:hypothetical protein|tara:strand:+ start:1426 stop:1581 length:156 start_codon:yes stop_codon:yes gene_type:complete